MSTIELFWKRSPEHLLFDFKIARMAKWQVKKTFYENVVKKPPFTYVNVKMLSHQHGRYWNVFFWFYDQELEVAWTCPHWLENEDSAFGNILKLKLSSKNESKKDFFFTKIMFILRNKLKKQFVKLIRGRCFLAVRILPLDQEPVRILLFIVDQFSQKINICISILIG